MHNPIVARDATPAPPEQSDLDTAAVVLAIDVIMHHRSLRDGHPMTLADVAREAGVNKSVLSNLRTGVAMPSLNSTLRIFRWLGNLPGSRFTRPRAGACAVCGADGPATTETEQAGAA